MGQKVDVTEDGRIVVEQDDGVFDFAVSNRETTRLRLVAAKWDRNPMDGLESLDRARVVALRVAEERGWIQRAHLQVLL